MSFVRDARAVFSSIREICHSVTKRYDNFRENPEQLGKLRDELANVQKLVSVFERTLQKYSEAIVTETLEFELVELEGIVQRIRHAAREVDELEDKLPKTRRSVSRANKNAEDISQLVRDVREASSLLSDMHGKLKETTKEKDFFTPKFPPTPRKMDSLYLDFSRDTMEGEVKAKVLASVNLSEQDTEDTTAKATAVVGVAGMGGIGKTTALIGLAQDPEIRETFSNGGIYFLTVGKDATPANLVYDLKEMVWQSGGKEYFEKMDSNWPLEKAVRRTSYWFSGRKALFILDDLWQTSVNQLGYFEELMELLEYCPDSHVVFSTRSKTIASETKARIEF